MGDAVTALLSGVAHSLRGEGHDASEDGTGRGVPLVPVARACVSKGGTGRHDPTSETLVLETVGVIGGDSSTSTPDLPTVTASHHCRTSVCTLTTGDRGVSVDQAAGGLLIPVAFNATQDPVSGHVSPCLGQGSSRSGQASVAVAVSVSLRGRDGGGTAEVGGGDVAAALRASKGGGDKAHVLAISGRDRGDDGRGYARTPHVSDLAGSLDTVKPDRVFRPGAAVRRLTPRECERLQGFPDDYTLIPSYWRRVKPDRVESLARYLGVPADELAQLGLTPDGPRYKALGNSFPVLVIRWLGRRIAWEMARARKGGRS